MYQDILNDDGTVTRWQDGISATYATEQEAKMATQPTAIDSFMTLNTATQATAKTLLRQLDELNDMLLANPQIEANATTDNDTAVLTAIALISSIRAYVDTDLISGLKVRHAVYKLG